MNIYIFRVSKNDSLSFYIHVRMCDTLCVSAERAPHRPNGSSSVVFTVF